MFPENLEALYELQTAVQEFTGSYVYIKGYNRCTVEKIQHMYMKTYRVRNQSSTTCVYIYIYLPIILLDHSTTKQITAGFMPYSL
jgi:hypothetical protein